MSIPLWEDDDSFWILPEGGYVTPDGSAELKTSFLVKQWYANLSCGFIVEQSGLTALKGRFFRGFDGDTSLAGNFTVRQSAAVDLKGVLVIRHESTRSLKARFWSAGYYEAVKGVVEVINMGSRGLKGILKVGYPGEVYFYTPAHAIYPGDGYTDGGIWNANYIAQTFTAKSSEPLKVVSLYLSRTGTPTDITLSLRATAAGLPNGADLASTSIPIEKFPFESAHQWIGVTFDTPYSLVAGTRYALVIKCTGDGGNMISWGISYNIHPHYNYTEGDVCISSDGGSTWSGYGINAYTTFFQIGIEGGLKGFFFVGYDGVPFDIKCSFLVRHNVDPLEWGDDFSTGDKSRWDYQGGSGVTISEDAHSGAYSLKVEIPAESYGDYVVKYMYNVSPSYGELFELTKVKEDFWFKLTQNPLLNYNEYCIIAWTSGVTLYLYREVDNSLRWRLYTANDVSAEINISSETVSLGVWYHVKLVFATGAVGHSELWVDDVELIHEVNAARFLYPLNDVSLGFQRYYATGPYTAYYDDFAIVSGTALKGIFYVSPPAVSNDLLGKFFIGVGDDVDLKAILYITPHAEVNLKGFFDVVQPNAELKGRLVVRSRGSSNLKAQLRVSVETANVWAMSPRQLTFNSWSYVYGVNWMAQTFNATTPSILGVWLYCYKIGTVGDLLVSIRAVGGNNKPTGGDLTSGTIAYARISSVSARGLICRLTPYTLTVGTKYAVVVREAAGDSSNKVGVGISTTNLYSGGNDLISSDSGTSWTAQTTYDFTFGIYIPGSLRGYFFLGHDADKDLKSKFVVRHSSDVDEANISIYNYTSCYGVNWIGQTFVARATGKIAAVSITPVKQGTPTADCILSIRATSAGLPTGGDLVASTIPASSITTAVLKRIELTPLSVIKGTTYAIIWRDPSATSGNYISVYLSYNIVTGDYVTGSFIQSSNSGSSWASQGTTYDLNFKIHPDHTLKAIFTVRKASSRTLKGKFSVRQVGTPRSLKARVFVGKLGSAKLKNSLLVRNAGSRSLKGKLSIISVRDLKAKFFIGDAGSTSLKGTFISRKVPNGRNLKGKLFVPQGSRSLKAKLSLNRLAAVDFKAKVAIARPASAALKARFTVSPFTSTDLQAGFWLVHPVSSADRSLKTKLSVTPAPIVTASSSDLKMKLFVTVSTSGALLGTLFIPHLYSDGGDSLKATANILQLSTQNLKIIFSVNQGRDAAELLGKFLVQIPTQDLKGIFEVNHPAAELKGVIYVTPTPAEDLPGVFAVRHTTTSWVIVEDEWPEWLNFWMMVGSGSLATPIREADANRASGAISYRVNILPTTRGYESLVYGWSWRPYDNLVPQGSQGLLGGFTVVNTTRVVLKGWFSVGQGAVDLKACLSVEASSSGSLKASFTVSTASSLKARFYIPVRISSDLPAGFTLIRYYHDASAELLSTFNVHQIITGVASGGLLGGLFVKVSTSHDLLGTLYIPHDYLSDSEELKAKFSVTQIVTTSASDDLKVSFFVKVRASHDLLGTLYIPRDYTTDTVELKGKLSVAQTYTYTSSVELWGGFFVEVRASHDLLGIFYIPRDYTTDSSNVLGIFNVSHTFVISNVSELKCLFFVKTSTSHDLLGTLYIPRDYTTDTVELKGKLSVTQIVTDASDEELLGFFFIEVKTSHDLLGTLYIPRDYTTDSVELKAKFSVAQTYTYTSSVEVLGAFFMKVRTSHDLLGILYISRDYATNTAKLKGKLSVTPSSSGATSKDLKGIFSVNISTAELSVGFTVRNSSITYELTGDPYNWANFWVKVGTGFLSAPAVTDEDMVLRIEVRRESASADALVFGWAEYPYSEIQTSRVQVLKGKFYIPIIQLKGKFIVQP